jgi:UDP-glucose 4-epimerase
MTLPVRRQDGDGRPVLVTGGAGYIGSHVTLALLEAGYAPVVVDNLSTGLRRLVPAGVPLIVGDVGDIGLMRPLLRERRIEAVLHFAGSIVVPESVQVPLDYYRNNTSASRSLIEACVAEGVGQFVFSSTAAVYGIPERQPIDEGAQTQPINPYGRSKLMTEWMLADAAAAHGLAVAVLRYFNVAGADAALRSGQCSRVATHLIKIACEVAVGRRAEVAVFGDDYPTPDGTCLRDYIHVSDLADAHVLALRRLEAGGGGLTVNCGYGTGHSVLAVLDAVDRATGRPLPRRMAPRRPGDPAALIAAGGKARDLLGWRPRYADLDRIVTDALAWERRCLLFDNAGDGTP